MCKGKKRVVMRRKLQTLLSIGLFVILFITGNILVSQTLKLPLFMEGSLMPASDTMAVFVIAVFVGSFLISGAFQLLLFLLDKNKELSEKTARSAAKIQMLSYAASVYVKLLWLDMDNGEVFEFISEEDGNLTTRKMPYLWDEYVGKMDEYFEEKSLPVQNLEKLREFKPGTVLTTRKSCFYDYANDLPSKEECWYTGTMILLENKQGRAAICTLSNDTDTVKKELTKSRSEQKKTELIHALSEDYDAIFYMNYETGDERLIRANKISSGDAFDEIHQGLLTELASLRDYSSAAVSPEYKEDFDRFFDSENVERELSRKIAITFTYTASLNGVQKYERVKMVRLGNTFDSREVVVGFANVNAEVIEEKEYQENMQAVLFNEKQMKRSLFSNAQGYYEMNLTKDILYAGITVEDGKEIPVPPLVGLDIPCKFSEFIEKLGDDTIVDGKEEFRSCYDRDGLIEYFEKGGLIREAEYAAHEPNNQDYNLKATVILNRNTEGDVVGTVIVNDVTEKKEREQELRDALMQADSANMAKTRFLSNISHDIRTPINAIMGMTTVAGIHLEDKEKVKDCLDKIDISSKHLLNLVNSVLDLSKIEAGKMELNEVEFNVNHAIHDIGYMNLPMAEKHNHKLTVERKNIVHTQLLGDVERISQIVNNLISNAIKYTPDGGEIKVKVTEVSHINDTCVYRVSVLDNGIGMSEEFAKTIFNSFTRENKEFVKDRTGTGLGMAITSNLVHMLGGEIMLRTKEGQGSKFIVTIPLKIIEKKEDPKGLCDEKTFSERNDFTGFRILLAEDNDFNAEIVEELVGLTGAECDRAQNGQEALNMMQECADNYYTMILMDIQMPVMDGYEATRMIRNLDREDAKNIPIVALSANAFASDVAKSKQAGMDEHLSKPIVLAQLEEVLNKYLK